MKSQEQNPSPSQILRAVCTKVVKHVRVRNISSKTIIHWSTPRSLVETTCLMTEEAVNRLGDSRTREGGLLLKLSEPSVTGTDVLHHDDWGGVVGELHRRPMICDEPVDPVDELLKVVEVRRLGDKVRFHGDQCDEFLYKVKREIGERFLMSLYALSHSGGSMTDGT